MKKLVTEKTMQDFIAGHGKGAKFPMDENTLLTPSAKDIARTNKIVFVDVCECTTADSSTCCTEEKPAESCSMSYDRQLIVEAVMKVLKEKGILDKILDK